MRIAVVILLIGRFAEKGIAYACMAVLIGDTLAETASCLYLGCSYMLDKRRLRTPTVNRQQTKGVVRKLLAIALPITAGRYLNSILRTIENILVPNCLTRYKFLQGTGPVGIRYAQGAWLCPCCFFPPPF